MKVARVWLWAVGLLIVVATVAAPGHSQAAPGTRTVYLIRHGDYNHDDPKDEHTGKGLTKLGKQQSKLVAARLAELPIRITSLTSSTLQRAKQTADLIGFALKIHVERDSMLSECTPPTSRPDIMAGLRPGEADSAQAQLDRAWFSYFDIATDGDANDVLVCHGNVIRWFTCRALGVDTKQWSNMDIANCSVTIITIKPDGTARLVTFSDVAHIPLKQQSWAGKGPGMGLRK